MHASGFVGGRAAMRYGNIYVDEVNDNVGPYWKYEAEEKKRKSYRLTREHCLADVRNQCYAMYPDMSTGYESCMLGMNVKQGTLPAAVRAAAAQNAYDINAMDGGLAYTIGYSMPLCPLRRD